MMMLGWLLTFLQQGQINLPIHLFGESVEKLFSENVLKTSGLNFYIVWLKK